MNLNRETAMRLWNKSFGKESKTADFAGRVMAKGAYNDRNSEFGWNVDHILPQSKGGVTADHNLVCCHILTNDEKADKFPCFNANGISFEIVKVERHYEIRERSKKKAAEQTHKSINLYDSAAGIRLFKSLKGIQNKKRFVGTVFVYLKAVSTGAVIDFIEKIFDRENISYNGSSNRLALGADVVHNVKIMITNYDMPHKSDIEELLDKCILLNTYLSGYFLECRYISEYNIYYRGDCFEEKFDLFRAQPIKEPNPVFLNFTCVNPWYALQNALFINELVRINTEAEDKAEKSASSEYTEYNYVFTKLKDNLIKEANG